MKLLDLTLDTAAANLALDEALLLWAEEQGNHEGLLRMWEPSTPLVVLGRSSQSAKEVELEFCHARGIEIGRRASGGAAIVTGPGCLMYAVVLSYEAYPAARMIDQAHRTVLTPLVQGLQQLDPRTQRSGTSDLALSLRKFSGNSLRCRRTHFLYHGTLLYDFPLDTISNVLAEAPRQPAYRKGRSHEAFVTNFPATALELRRMLLQAWAVEGDCTHWPHALCEQLVAEKYATEDWKFGR